METASDTSSSSNEEQIIANTSAVKCNPESKLIFCTKCDKQFTLKSSLNRHFKAKHMNETSISEPGDQQNSLYNKAKLKCSECPQQFGTLKSLTHHKKKNHSVSIAPPLKEHVCPLCKKCFYGKEILTHFQSFHDIDIETEVLQFDNFDGFLTWKKDMEAQTKSFFRITSRNVWKSKEKTNHHFICHRSGDSSSQNGESKLPKSSTKRINAYCPAFIKVEEFREGKCFVTFMQTHVGHEENLYQTNSQSKEAVSKDTGAKSVPRQRNRRQKKLCIGSREKTMQFQSVVNFSEEEIKPGLPDEINEDGIIVNSICTSVACFMLNQHALTKKNVHEFMSKPQTSLHTNNNDSVLKPTDDKDEHNMGSEETNAFNGNDCSLSLGLNMEGDINQKSSNDEVCSSDVVIDASSTLTLEERQSVVANGFSELVDSLTHREEVRAAEILLTILKDTITVINDSNHTTI